MLMQAITIAIGQSGIQFLAQQLISNHIVQLIALCKPPDQYLSVAAIPNDTTTISITLTQGIFSSFNPAFQAVVQQSGGAFLLTIQAGAFGVSYNWAENFWKLGEVYVPGGNSGYKPLYQVNKNFAYTPTFNQMSVNIPLLFTYDNETQSWDISARASTNSTTVENANIPSGSIIQQEDQDCFTSHVDAATTQAVTSINLGSQLNNLIAGLLLSIPASGQLGNGIVYDFSLGDSGLLFPNNDGIQLGVTGGASYNGTAFSGETPPSLPIPPPLADSATQHLNMYVSNYAVDALSWAFFMAGKLNTVINAADLPDAGVLQVKTYSVYTPALEPYQIFDMQAQVVQNVAPRSAFQTVYQLPPAVMTVLASQLPATVWQQLNDTLQGNNYVSQASLESDLQAAGIDASYFNTIEAAAENMGLVVTHDIAYTLTIQNGQAVQPTIVFNVTRVDILGNLSLNLNTNKAQTMQFSFLNASWNAVFVSSSIAGLDASSLDMIWGQAGESEYSTLLVALGSLGVPVPIMQGFQFDFTHAQLSVQQGYVSILADVEYTS